MMKKSVAAGLLILALSCPLLANATPWLDSLKARSSQLTGMTADFKQTKVFSKLDLKITSSGLFKFNRDEKDSFSVLWHIRRPSELKVHLSADQLKIEQDGKSKQVPAHGDAYGTLLALIALDFNKIEKHYKIQELENQKLILRPKVVKTAPYIKMVLSFTSGLKIHRLDIYEKSLDKLKIEFVNHRLKWKK